MSDAVCRCAIGRGGMSRNAVLCRAVGYVWDSRRRGQKVIQQTEKLPMTSIGRVQFVLHCHELHQQLFQSGLQYQATGCRNCVQEQDCPDRNQRACGLQTCGRSLLRLCAEVSSIAELIMSATASRCPCSNRTFIGDACMMAFGTG